MDKNSSFAPLLDPTPPPLSSSLLLKKKKQVDALDPKSQLQLALRLASRAFSLSEASLQQENQRLRARLAARDAAAAALEEGAAALEAADHDALDEQLSELCSGSEVCGGAPGPLLTSTQLLYIW